MNPSTIDSNASTYDADEHSEQKGYSKAWHHCRGETAKCLHSGSPSISLAESVRAGLEEWDMEGILDAATILTALRASWEKISFLSGFDLHNLTALQKPPIETAYKNLSPLAEKDTLTVKSKVLLLTWGGTPAFDSRVRAHGADTILSDGSPLWIDEPGDLYLPPNKFAALVLRIAEDYQQTCAGQTSPGKLTHARHLDKALFVAPV